MASAWGDSWAAAWGDSWGSGIIPPPPQVSKGGYWPHDIRIIEEEKEKVVDVQLVMPGHVAVTVANVPHVGMARVIVPSRMVRKRYQEPARARLNRAVAARQREDEAAMLMAIMLID